MHSKDAQPSHTSVYRFKNNLGQKNRVRLTIKTVHRKSSKFMHTHLRPIGKKKGPDATPQKQQLILQTL